MASLTEETQILSGELEEVEMKPATESDSAIDLKNQLKQKSQFNMSNYCLKLLTQGLTGKSSNSSNDENTPVKTHHIFPLQHGVNKIGRSESSHICILDKGVSKNHACIELEEADEGKVNVYIWDVESQNKTKLNSQVLVPNQRTQVSLSDQIQLGSVRFSLTEMSADEKSEQEKDRCHLVIGDGLDVDSNGVTANGNGHHVNGKTNGVKLNSLFEIQNTLEETSGENGSENAHKNLNGAYFKMCSEDTEPEDDTAEEGHNDMSLNDSNNLSMSLRLDMTVNQSTLSGRVPKTPTTVVITETMVVDDEATREEYEEEEEIPAKPSTDEAPKPVEVITPAEIVPETVAVVSDTVPVEETQPVEISKEPEQPVNKIEDQTDTLIIPDSLPTTTATTTTTNESTTEVKMDQQDPDIIPETQRIEDTQPVASSLIQDTQDLVTSSAATINSEANIETESKAESIPASEEKIETPAVPETSSSKSTVVAKKEEESIIMSDEETDQVKMAPPSLPPIKQAIVVAKKLTQQEIIVESTVLDTSIVDPASQAKSDLPDDQPEEKQPARRGRPSKKIVSSQSSDDAPKKPPRKSRAAQESVEPTDKDVEKEVANAEAKTVEKSPLVEIIDSEMREVEAEPKEPEPEKKVQQETVETATEEKEVPTATKPVRSRASARAASTDEPVNNQESVVAETKTTAPQKALRGRRKTIQVTTKDVEEAEKQVQESEEPNNSESMMETTAELPPAAPARGARGRGRPSAAATVASTSVNEEDQQQQVEKPASVRGRRGSANKEPEADQPTEKAPTLTRRSSLRTRNPPAAPVVVPKTKKVAEETEEPSKDLDESELMPAPPVPVDKPTSTLKRRGTVRGKKEKEVTEEQFEEPPPPPPSTPVSVVSEDSSKQETEKKGRKGAKSVETVEVEDNTETKEPEEEVQPKKASVGRRKSFATAKKEEQSEAVTEAKSRLRDRRKTLEVSAVAVAAANAKIEEKVTKTAPKRGAKNQSLSEVKEEESEEQTSTKKAAPKKRKSAIAEAVQRAAESAYDIDEDVENEEEAEAETSAIGKRKRKSVEPKETKVARGKRKSKSTEEDADGDGNTSNNESTNTPKLFFQSKQRLEANVSKSASASSNAKSRYSNLITTPKRQSLAPSSLAVTDTPGSSKKFKLNKSGNQSNYSFSEDEEDKAEQVVEKPKDEVVTTAVAKKTSPSKSPPKKASAVVSDIAKTTSASVSRRKSVRFGKGTNSTPIIMTTGLVLDEKHQQMIKNLGGETTTNVKECTHLITNKVRKTLKFLCCVSRSVHILSDRWLEESNRQKTFLNPTGFELQDPQSEKQLKFSLQTSLLKAKSSELLHGWKFLLKYEPKPEDELSVNDIKTIIECAGGEVVEKLPSRKDHRSKCCIIYTDLDQYKAHQNEDEDLLKTLCDTLCDSILRQSFEPKLVLDSNDA